ncbi:hypothetical protein QTP70_002542 [Hemibagrus guttatus]|uniref:Ig-like domain-containing protein n=1 Tax=Hemibagrus guttatus TaxID=175788 RepID=A0AAE0PQ47_9TELE|nr:hypothetical protein QTP70_002542 [Hemibagrus guttatus]
MAKIKELSKDTRNKIVDLHQAGKTESAIGDSMADSIETLFTHKVVDEGDDVTLSCKYKSSAATNNYLHWTSYPCEAECKVRKLQYESTICDSMADSIEPLFTHKVVDEERRRETFVFPQDELNYNRELHDYEDDDNWPAQQNEAGDVGEHEVWTRNPSPDRSPSPPIRGLSPIWTPSPVRSPFPLFTPSPVRSPSPLRIPSPDPIPCKESIPSFHPIPREESIPSLGPIPCKESIPSFHPIPREESIPSLDPIPCKESIPSFHPIPREESIPSLDPIPCKESIPSFHPIPHEDPSPVRIPSPLWTPSPVRSPSPLRTSSPVRSPSPLRRPAPSGSPRRLTVPPTRAHLHIDFDNIVAGQQYVPAMMTIPVPRQGIRRRRDEEDGEQEAPLSRRQHVDPDGEVDFITRPIQFPVRLIPIFKREM